jgi:menaquinone-9 beta-reductase
MLEGSSDVLVIGAGPGGSAAAITAARLGKSVCVVDRARFPRPKTCGDAISNHALAIATDLVGEDAASKVPRAIVRGAVAIFPDGSRVRRGYGDAPGFIMERVAFDDMLRRGAERAGAAVHEGVTVRRLLSRGGRFTGAEGPGFRWAASVVVVADGTASLAWDALGTKPPEDDALGVSATAYYEGLGEGVDAGFSEHYFEKSLPTGYGWIFPGVSGRSNVGVYLRVDRYHAGKVRLRELLDDFVARHAGRFDGSYRVGAPRSWSLPLATFGRPPCGPGLLSCGDAARLIDPLTGEGIWHALHSGRLAGRLAAESIGQASARSLERDYVHALRREVLWPTAARRGLEKMTTFIVDHDLYRSAMLRRLLERGYNARSLEVSKTMRAG